MIQHRDEFVICVGLERFKDFTHYPVLLSHEYCHYVQNNKNGKTGEALMDRLIREGISIYFSKLAYPGKKESKYLFMRENTFQYLKSHYTEILRKILKCETESMDIFHAQSDLFPPRTGYYMGYRMVRDFVEKSGKSDIGYLIEQYRSIYIDSARS